VTCVGVYFALSDNRCFCAHINTSIPDDGGGYRRSCNEREGEATKQEVLKLLQRCAKNYDWDAKDARIGTMVISCPEQRYGIVRATGWWAIEAIKEFLGLSEVDVEKQWGFVVDHDTKEVQWLTYGDAEDDEDDDEGCGKKSARFRKVPEITQADGWAVTVRPQE